MAKHFVLEIEEEAFAWKRNETKIAEEAALHGMYTVPSKESRQFTKHPSGLSRTGNTNAVLYNLDGTLSQEPKQICPPSLLDDHLACAEAPDVAAVNEFQDPIGMATSSRIARFRPACKHQGYTGQITEPPISQGRRARRLVLVTPFVQTCI
jgi:hypothetical protein